MPGEWIGCDLDGTLAKYDESTWDPLKIGKPIPKMLKLVKRLLAEGKEVRIFTARMSSEAVPITFGSVSGLFYPNVPEVKKAIEKWCVKHLGVKLPITNVKDYGMKMLYDDRAKQVEKNTGRILG